MRHTVYLFDGFQLDVTRRKLISNGGLVQPVNSRAMDALLLLVANAGELIEKRRLMQTVWPNAIVEDNNLNQCILAIRRALGEAAGSNRYVMTVPGRGYRFVSPVREAVQESVAEAPASSAPRQRAPQLLWLLGTVAMVSAVVTVVLVLRNGGASAAPQTSGSKVTGTSDRPSPAIVLRLRDAPAAGAGNAAVSATALLAQCLAARPDLNLRVHIELMRDDGAPEWTGEFIADSHDVLSLTLDTAAAAGGCRELIAKVRRARQDVAVH